MDSLIPNIYDEDFDSNSAQSLEDMMQEEESVEEVLEDIESKKDEKSDENDVSKKDTSQDLKDGKNDQEDVGNSDGDRKIQEKEPDEEIKEETQEENGSSEDLSGDSSSEENVQTPQKIEVKEEHVDEVREIVNKNPRITLWSSRSSAVFRYLRKTEPEFSISKEASVLIEEAVAKKYPEIWALFEDL